MKCYVKWLALFLSVLLMAASGYFIFSAMKANEEQQKLKERMLFLEGLAFMEDYWDGRDGGYRYYINIDKINKIRLQINLYAYEDTTGIVITLEDVFNFLESEMDENRYSTKTFEDNPIIENYVYWAVVDDFGFAKTTEYFHNFYDCLVEYKEENGLTEYSYPNLSSLTLEELSQLREKIKNPDYELTIDLTRED